jgi:membrane-associated phospholipid phosphatase
MLLLVKSREVFFNTFWACLLATLILNISYVAFPSFYPRAIFEVNTLSEALVEWTRQIDAANNTFPSGHVAFSWLLCLGIMKSSIVQKHEYIGRVYFLWAIGISLSTLVLKQHYIIDVVSGILLALACFYLAKPITTLHVKLVTSDARANT